MSNPAKSRKARLISLTTQIGCYVLADLDGVPLYVGQSTQGIRTRVHRHLTSARSDIIANRQIDVWEVAYVWAYPVEFIIEIKPLEAALFHHFNDRQQLMNGSIPAEPINQIVIPDSAQRVQVLSDEEIRERQSPELRLPRQAQHYARLVDHFLVVKSSDQIARSMEAHFERLTRYHASLLLSSN